MREVFRVILLPVVACLWLPGMLFFLFLCHFPEGQLFDFFV